MTLDKKFDKIYTIDSITPELGAADFSAPFKLEAKVNGEGVKLADGSYVGEGVGEYFLGVPKEVFESSACVGQMSSTEINGEIVPKAQYAQTVLKDGDSVEVVSFVGGG